MKDPKDYSKEVEKLKKDIDFNKFNYEVKFETSSGDIHLELYPEVAPGHCKNIIALSQAGYYDGLNFHRIVKDFVIQGGCPRGTGAGGPGYVIDAEFSDRKHLPGTLSMARTSEPNSAGSQFFLCLNKVPYLDNSYTVFGQTKDQKSLDVVLAIGQSETDRNDRPVKEVKIVRAIISANAV